MPLYFPPLSPLSWPGCWPTLEFDLEEQKIRSQGNTNDIKLKLKEGSRTKIVESLDLTFLLLFFYACQFIFQYTGSERREMEES